MSVLIKGMEMPKKGLLEIIISPDGICYALERPLIDTEHAKITKYYDTIELTNHGDLIDKAALEYEFICLSNDEWNKKTGTSWARAFEEASDVVYNALTVIPAEGSEE